MLSTRWGLLLSNAILQPGSSTYFAKPISTCRRPVRAQPVLAAPVVVGLGVAGGYLVADLHELDGEVVVGRQPLELHARRQMVSRWRGSTAGAKIAVPDRRGELARLRTPTTDGAVSRRLFSASANIADTGTPSQFVGDGPQGAH